MDLLELLEQLNLIIQHIDVTVDALEKNFYKGLREIPELMEQIQGSLADWFFFIEQTQLGSKELIVDILKDVMNAVQAGDEVLLLDALIYGLQSTTGEYYDTIKGVLFDE